MGIAQFDLNVPVLKNTNALLAFTNIENSDVSDPQCIRCGRCASVCPIRLQPIMLNLYASHDMFNLLQKNGIKDCIECGSCAYICPGRLPLVQTFRTAKQKLVNFEKKEAEK